MNQDNEVNTVTERKPCNWEECISIKVSKDKLEAYLQIDRQCEEQTVDISILKGALNKAKIAYGILEEKLLNIADNIQMYKGEQLLIAQGIAAINGIDGYIELIRDDIDKNQNNAPILLKDGRVDFFNIREIPSVLRGEEIAKKIDPIQGKPGIDVYGGEIKPRVPKNPRFPIGKNVVVNKEGTSIYALIDGQVSITERGKINVFSLYEVHGDVDFSTGNIDFVGSVLINGNVLSGFTVKAKGDIRVKGNIEGAFVESEGSIEIAGGVIGYHKGYIKAKQNFKASFLQNAIVTVDNDVVVSDSIMHSQVNAGRTITLDGTKALIVGGLLRAGEEVSAKVIGNSMATPTEIQVGVSPELRNELIEIRSKLKEINANFEKTEQALTILNQLKQAGRISEDKEKMRVKLESNIKSMKEYQIEGLSRIQELEQALDEAVPARVKGSSVIYPGVKIIIGKEIKVIRDEVKRSVFFIKDGEITFMPMR